MNSESRTDRLAEPFGAMGLTTKYASSRRNAIGKCAAKRHKRDRAG